MPMHSSMSPYSVLTLVAGARHVREVAELDVGADDVEHVRPVVDGGVLGHDGEDPVAPLVRRDQQNVLL